MPLSPLPLSRLLESRTYTLYLSLLTLFLALPTGLAYSFNMQSIMMLLNLVLGICECYVLENGVKGSEMREKG